MKTVLFALIFLTACSTVPSLVPSLTLNKAPERTAEPLVAKFEPSIPPPTSATDVHLRGPAGKDKDDSLKASEIEKLWVQVEKKRKDSLIRSNPNHYWAWMKKNISNSEIAGDLEKIAEFKGQVVADAHYFNFSDIHKDEKSGLALVDVDDSGKGSLYLDFVRYATFVKAYMGVDKDTTTGELLDAYLDGLKQKEKNLPDFLIAAMSKSRKDLLKEHGDWVAKSLKNKKLDYKSLEIMSLKDKKVGKNKEKTGEALGDLLKQKGKAKKIHDIGYTVSTSGSSIGKDRFWFSLETEDERPSIYECKQLGQPATAYYSSQKNHVERISDVLKIYSDFDTKDSYVFETTSETYWCRPKHFDFFRRSVVEDNVDKTKKMIDYSRYLAYWMGYKHSYQKEGDNLKKAITGEEKNILKDTVKLIEEYEKDSFSLNNHK